MFGFFRRKSGAQEQAKPVTLADLPNTPKVIFSEAADSFAEIYGSSRVEAQRWFAVAMATIGMSVVLVLCIMTLMPMKEFKLMLVEFNGTTGVVNRPVEVTKIDPNQMVIKAELKRWVEAVFTIDPLRYKEMARFANVRTAEKATGQYSEYRSAERLFERIQREPDLIREAKVTALDLGQKGTAFVYLTTTERTGLATPGGNQIKRFRVTLNYKLFSTTNEAEMMENPLGLMVTYFSYVEDRAP